MDTNVLKTIFRLEEEICSSVRKVKESLDLQKEQCLPDHEAILSLFDHEVKEPINSIEEANTWLGQNLERFKKFNALVVWSDSLFNQHQKLVFQNDRLMLDEQAFMHAQIQHLQIKTRDSRNVMTKKTSLKWIELKIKYKHCDQVICLNSKDSIDFAHCQGQSMMAQDCIWAIYLHLSHKTFRQRLQAYISQMQVCDFFEYDEDQALLFFENGVLQKGKHWLDLYECEFNCMPGRMHFYERKTGSKLKRLWSRRKKRISFKTIQDHDVLFFLLRKYYNMVIHRINS